jgi:hypothetical protein
MLGQNDCAFIETNGWIMDNDWELLSCLFGEAFLFDVFICFWDGINVTVCAYPIEQSTLLEGIRERLFDTVKKCLSQFAPKVIDIWGPQNIPLDSILPSNFNRVGQYLGDPDNVNIQIHYAEYGIPRNRNFRNAKHAENAGVHCKITQGSEFTWQHFVLIEKLATRDDFGNFDRTYSALAPILTRSPKTTMFEAFKDEELLGFILVREVLREVAIATWASYNKGSLKASDFLQYKMIEHYQQLGVSSLDLGYSAHRNLLEYKHRWGVNVNNGPYYGYSYIRDDYIASGKYSGYWWVRDFLQSVLFPIENQI